MSLIKLNSDSEPWMYSFPTTLSFRLPMIFPKRWLTASWTVGVDSRSPVSCWIGLAYFFMGQLELERIRRSDRKDGDKKDGKVVVMVSPSMSSSITLTVTPVTTASTGFDFDLQQNTQSSINIGFALVSTKSIKDTE